MTIVPPPSLSWHRYSCRTSGSAFSDQPRTTRCPLSITSLRPLRSSSMRVAIISLTKPSMTAVTSIPPTEIAAATTRSDVLRPSPPTNDQLMPAPSSTIHASSYRLLPLTATRPDVPTSTRSSVSSSSDVALAWVAVLNQRSIL